MMKNLLKIVLFTATTFNGFAHTSFKRGELSQLEQPFGISFTENKGQVYDQNFNSCNDVLFSANVGKMTVHIKKNGVSYQLFKEDSFKELKNVIASNTYKELEKLTLYRIDLIWKNANKNFTTSVDAALPGLNNYYLQNCPNGILNVRSYSGIILHNLYDGIDLHYYSKDSNLKYDYIIAPHSNYKQIKIELSGAHVEINKDGSLYLTTPLGKVKEGEPIVYQNGKRLSAKWIVTDNTLSFDVNNYDPNYELIIDPVTRLWGTYYGGAGLEYCWNSCTDASGNVFLTGQTATSTGTLIATSGAHQTSINGGTYDAFLVKFNSSGIRQWGTFYGGGGLDYGWSCSTDASGNVFLAGFTDSNTGTFIATAGSHQTTYGGGTNDAFLIKFNSNGVRQWGTLYGGAGDDRGYSCSTDASGNIYLNGWSSTSTGTAIASAGSHQPANGGGLADSYLAKFNTNGIRQWATYYGGVGDDLSSSCVTDASGNVFITGTTTSSLSTIIATAGSHQNVIGGLRDAFLVKFNGNGIRQWGTYYGSSGDDFGYSCSADAGGSIFLAGKTNSSAAGTAIATVGSHQASFGGGVNDAFLVKFNSAGTRQWGTYYGGSGDDWGWSCGTDGSGNVFISGQTDSNTGNFIASTGAYQSSFGGGAVDGFLTKFSSVGTRQWGTYYGGGADDKGISLCTDVSGNVFLAGYSSSSTGTSIASAGSHQSIYGGGTYDGFITKFKDCASLNPIASSNASICSGANISLNVNISGTVSPTYNWSGPGSYTSNIQNPIISGATTANSGIYTVTVINAGCVETSTTQSIVNPNPNVVAISSATNFICVGETTTLTASGANSYTWNTGATTAVIIVSPTITTTYTVIGADSGGCINSATVSQNVNACPGIFEYTNENNSLKIYPNPFSTVITILSGGEKQTITIYNTLGELVHTEIIEQEKTEIDLHKLASGLYFIRSNSSIQKIIKE